MADCRRGSLNRRLLQLYTILALETLDHHTEESPNFVLTQTIEHYAVNRRLVRLMQIGHHGRKWFDVVARSASLSVASAALPRHRDAVLLLRSPRTT
jgi:hypothetical protein